MIEHPLLMQKSNDGVVGFADDVIRSQENGKPAGSRLSVRWMSQQI